MASLDTVPQPAVWSSLPRVLYACGMRRGLGRALMTAARRIPGLRTISLRVSDGRVIVLDLSQLQCVPYALTGEIPNERGETRLVRSLLEPGETAIDIGANLGWYTTLMAERVGVQGRIIAFEPNPRTLRLLNLTSRAYPQVTIVPLALLDHDEEGMTLNLPEDGTGSSLCNLRSHPKVAEEQCASTTLDGYLEREGVHEVAFVKCDVEGVELPAIRGAERLLTGVRPPLWFAEVNSRERFGNDPSELLGYFLDRGFAGYHIDPESGRLGERLGEIAERYDALFVPPRFQGRVERYLKAFGT